VGSTKGYHSIKSSFGGVQTILYIGEDQDLAIGNQKAPTSYLGSDILWSFSVPLDRFLVTS
jgi:hypothetical protein